MRRFLCCCLVLAGLTPAVRADFDGEVAPLLASKCLECHSRPKPKGKLDLTSLATAAKGGRNGPAFVAGKPDKSLLWEYVSNDKMPPKHPLDQAEKRILRSWISDGAKWPHAIDRFAYTTKTRAGYDWWSLQPIRRPAVPKISPWAHNPIDAFVEARLREKGITPSEQADPATLVRRLYIDLVGLPPSPAVVAEFVGNPTESAYAKLVDDLLASPAYGERWGRHWLDVVRFGESDGFERNNPRRNFWPYRDWVISAFNEHLPYDRFVRRQLVGDIERPGPEGASAVGMLVAGVHNTVVGSSERMKRLARQDELEEIVGTVGQTFLGLTVNCARCHDHKFDPIRNTEYYQLISAIDGVNFGERDVTGPTNREQFDKVVQRIDAIRKELVGIDAKARKAILAKREKDPKPTPSLPKPMASWNFDTDLNDSVGNLHGTAKGSAKLENGALVLDGRSAFVETPRIQRELAEKTLEAWVILDDLNQRGGGVISVETVGGQIFDAIVFGEREPRKWMAGSNGFVRTKSFAGPAETDAGKPVHIAIVYERDGTVRAFRNGRAYGKPYKTGKATFLKNGFHIVFGMRHAPAGSNKMLKGRILRANLYDYSLSPDAVAASAGVENTFVSDKEINAWLSPQQRTHRIARKAELAGLEREKQQLESRRKQRLYTVLGRNPGVMKVHVRGSVTDFGEEVAPGGVASVKGVTPKFGIAKNAPDAQRRTKLADWITSPKNPLFPRVIANRIWHYHFGTGIVETPNDLGFNGGRPSHPQLLDWLAHRLRADGYRLETLHRLIVTSATYRQASTPNAKAKALDANNRLLWRYPPRRVEAEVLRDSMLAVAGVLNTTMGGPGFEDVTSTPNNGTMYYEPVDRAGHAFHRRTVYRFTPRGGRSAVLDTFDCPDPSTKAPRRSITTTPLQALSLLNNAFVLRMATAFADRVKTEAGDDIAKQVTRAWQLALCRPPTERELTLGRNLVKRRGLAALCRGLFNVNEFVVVE